MPKDEAVKFCYRTYCEDQKCWIDYPKTLLSLLGKMGTSKVVRLIAHALLCLSMVVLLAAPVMRFRAAERVSNSLWNSYQASAAGEISRTTVAGYAHWLEGSDSSDPFCSTAKSFAKTAGNRDVSDRATSSSTLTAVVTSWTWTPGVFESREMPCEETLFKRGPFEAPPFLPPKV